MNPEQWLSLKWNGGSTMSDRWLNQSKIIQLRKVSGNLSSHASQTAHYNSQFQKLSLTSSNKINEKFFGFMIFFKISILRKVS